MLKKRFSHYTCCKLRDLGGQENWSKKWCQKSLYARGATAAPKGNRQMQIERMGFWNRRGTVNQHHDLNKSTDQGIKSHEKGIKMEAQIDAKSIRNRVCDGDAFWDRFWKPNAPNPPKYGSLFWDACRAKIEEIQFEKASTNQCKMIFKFEAKGVQKWSQNATGNRGFT